MNKKSRKYGTYYGELVGANEELHYLDFESEEIDKKLKDCGVVEVLFDVEEGSNYSDTLFFEIDKITDLKELMILIVNYGPDEFTEETENHFRMWFD